MAIQFLNTGYFPDNAKLTFGDATTPDLEIYHDGSHSRIDDTGTGGLILRTGDFYLRNPSDADMIYAASGGAVKLYYNNVVKFETYNTGAGLTGNLYFTSGNGIHFDNGVSNDYYIDKSSTTLEFNTGGTYVFNTGNVTFAGDVEAPVYLAAQTGYSDGYRLTRAAHDTYRLCLANSQGLRIFNETDSRIEAQFIGDGSVAFYGNVTTTGTLTVGTVDSKFGENQLRFNSASTAYIDHGTTSQNIKFRLSNSSALDVTMLEITPSYLVAAGSIFVGADSTYDLGTTANRWANIWVDNINGAPPFSGSYLPLAGGTMTGDVIYDDNVKIKLGTGGGNSDIYHNGTDMYIRQLTTAGDLSFAADSSGSGGAATAYFWLDGGVVKTRVAKDMNFETSVKASFGNVSTPGMMIWHDGSNGSWQNDIGDIYIRQAANDKDIIILCDDGSGGHTPYITLDGSAVRTTFDKQARFIDDAQLQLGTDGDLKLWQDGTDSIIRNTAGTFYIDQSLDGGDLKFRCDNGSGGITSYFYMDGSAVNTRFVKDIKLNDNTKALFGGSDDLQIYHDASNSYISQGGIGDLYIQQNTDNKDIVFQSDDGNGATTTYFYLDGSLADGTYTYTTWVDNGVLGMGTGSDLQLYHTGTDSYISNKTGDLYIKARDDDKDVIFQSDNGSGGTATYFYLDGSSSSAPARYTVFPTDSYLTFGDNKYLELFWSTNGVVRNHSGDLYIDNYQDDGDIKFRADDGSGSNTEYLRLDGGITSIIAYKDILFGADSIYAKWGASQDLIIGHDGSNSKIENYTGHLNIIQEAADKDITFYNDDGSGGTTEYFRVDGSSEKTIFAKEVLLNDSVYLKLGGGGDLQLYHDGSNSFIKNSTGSLVIEQAAGAIALRPVTGENGILIVENAAVSLYYDNSKKLETTSTGVTITGDVGATTLTLTGKGTSAATVDGDGSTTMVTKGWVESKLTGATLYQGTWDPSGGGYGSPDLSTGSLQVNGYYYICSADGTAEPNGTGTEPDTWHTGDWVIWNDDVGSGEWQKIDNTTVLSGAGTGEYLARWTDSETLGDSVVLASGDDILIPRYVGHVGDTNTYFGFSGNDTIQFNTNGSERMRIHSSGNVAIGTTIDINALDVAGNINIQGGNGGYLTFNNGDANIVINNNGTGRDLSFKTYDGSSNAERMRIDKDGNVGIGTATPSYKLDVYGIAGTDQIARFESPDDGAFIQIRDNDTLGQVTVKDSVMAIGLGSNHPGSTMLNVVASGAVGIGTSSPEKKLHVLTSTTDSTPQVLVQNSSSGDASLQFNISGTSYTLGIDNSDSDKFKISTSALGTNDRLSIDSSGAVTIGGTVTTGAITTTGTLTVNSGHVNIDSGYSFQWGDTHERIEQSDGKIEFFTNNTEQMTLSGSNLGIGTTTPDAKLEVNGGIIAGGKTTYTIVGGSVTTTGTAVAGVSTGTNGQSSGFIFTCFGGDSGYQRIVYSCKNISGTWDINKDIDEGANGFDVTYAADGSDNITFTFKSRSGATQYYAPKVTVEAVGDQINQSYIN